jgi:hypothetical protein
MRGERRPCVADLAHTTVCEMYTATELCSVCLHPRRRHHYRKPMATLTHTHCPHTAHHHAGPVAEQTGKRLAERDLSKTKTHTWWWRWCVVVLERELHSHSRAILLPLRVSSSSETHSSLSLTHTHTHTHSLTHTHTQLSVSSQPRSHLPRSRFQGGGGWLRDGCVLVVLTCHNGLGSHFDEFSNNSRAFLKKVLMD